MIIFFFLFFFFQLPLIQLSGRGVLTIWRRIFVKFSRSVSFSNSTPRCSQSFFISCISMTESGLTSCFWLPYLGWYLCTLAWDLLDSSGFCFSGVLLSRDNESPRARLPDWIVIFRSWRFCWKDIAPSGCCSCCASPRLAGSGECSEDWSCAGRERVFSSAPLLWSLA